MKILIIEDDETLVNALRRRLMSVYVIDVAYDGQDGLHYAEVNDYDAIILDLTLPGSSGRDICKDLRSKGNLVPILILTGQSNVQNKVELLDDGADDYLTKPFSSEELKARLRALIRKGFTSRPSLIEVGELKLDMASRTVIRYGVTINLRRKEFDLLEYLMHNSNKVVTRSMIVDHVWDMNENLWTNAVDVHIKYLRDKIDRPFDEPMIKTIHGVGYKLESNEPNIAKIAGAFH